MNSFFPSEPDQPPPAASQQETSPQQAAWRRAIAAGLRRLIWAEQLLAIALLSVVIVTMAAQVIWRYVLQSPLSWSEEVARLAMIWLTFIAASFVLATRQHIVVDLIGDGDSSTAGDSSVAGPPGSGSGSGISGRGSGARSLGRTLTAAVGRLVRCRRLVAGLMLAGVLVLLFGGFAFVVRVYPVGSPSVNLSMTFWYAAPLVGLALMAVHLVAELLGIETVPPGPPVAKD